MRILIAALLMVSTVAFGQGTDDASDESVMFVSPEQGVETEVIPGIRIIIDPTASSDMEIADEIYYFPHFLEPIIPFDKDFTTFTLDLSSRVTTRIFIEVEDETNLVSRSDDVVVQAGTQFSASFAAYAPHAGVIRLLNEEHAVLAEVPYNVVKQSQIEQNVSGFATTAWTTDFDSSGFEPVAVGVGYGIRERVTGIAASIRVEYSTNGRLAGTATVSGSHTW